MERKEIIAQLGKYFKIAELVCKHTHDKFGGLAWQFLDTELLETILVLRTKIINAPMNVNDWHLGGVYDERGLRCNLCDIVKDNTSKNRAYLSAHCNGAGIDFTVVGKESNDVRDLIKKNAALLPYPIRLEKDVAWVHIDIYDDLSGSKVSEFSA